MLKMMFLPVVENFILTSAVMFSPDAENVILMSAAVFTRC
jgi:hypothetical protein